MLISSALLRPDSVSVGASGALLGLMGGNYKNAV